MKRKPSVAWTMARDEANGLPGLAISVGSHICLMCRRCASYLPPDALARLFSMVNPLPNLQPTWNLAPTDDAPVVRLAEAEEADPA